MKRLDDAPIPFARRVRPVLDRNGPDDGTVDGARGRDGWFAGEIGTGRAARPTP